MEASDLRIGNLVETNYQKDEWVLQSVGISLLSHIIQDPELAKPIGLTTKWLERIGFINVKEDSWAKYKYHEYVNGNTLEVVIDAINKTGGSMLLNGEHFAYCNYIHMLQNLYFVLTGEELNIFIEETINA